MTQIISISVDDLRRNFGAIKKQLPFTDFVITDRGKPIAELTASLQEKRAMMENTFGAWKDTPLSDDTLWKEVFKRKSRKNPIRL